MSDELAQWLRAGLEERCAQVRCVVATYRGLDEQGRAEPDAGARWREAVLTLAELETKGRLVDLHRGGHRCRVEYDAIGAGLPVSQWTRRADEWTAGPCLTLRLLAAPYRGWPGWREEWSA